MDVHLENEQEVVGKLSDSIHPWMHFKRSRMGAVILVILDGFVFELAVDSVGYKM